jgi:hypothetical protein
MLREDLRRDVYGNGVPPGNSIASLACRFA